MTESEVLDKIHQLPKPVQNHLYMYVDFLYNTYLEQGTEAASTGFLEEFELTQAAKDWLEKRAEQAVSKPEKRTAWKDVLLTSA